MAKNHIPDHLRAWIEARQRFHLSHAQVQMARELGINPRKLGKIANDDQEPWKMPLPQFIAHIYQKRFGRELPPEVMSIEDKSKKAPSARKLKNGPNKQRESSDERIPVL